MSAPLLTLLLALAAAPEQVVPDTLLHLPHLGGVAEDRIRLGQFMGDGPVDDLLIRSPSSLFRIGSAPRAMPSGPGLHLRWLEPEIRGVWNSTLPHSLNEGALWAGRGLSSRLTVGLHARLGAFTLILAPHVLMEENRSFQTISHPEGVGRRSRMASPFHYPTASMGVQQRFGESSRFLMDPGQSTLSVQRGSLEWGVATENVWWGPSIRNALLMGAQ